MTTLQPTADASPRPAPGAPILDTVSRREAEFFDSVIREEGDFNPFQDRGWQTLARRFKELVPANGPLDILDIGCGAGQSRQLYIDRARSYTGIDLSAGALQAAERWFPDSKWIQADACDLPFEDCSVDVVAFSSVLHHIPNFQIALREAFRALRPCGYAFAFDPNLLHPAMALFRCPKSPLYLRQGVSPNERPLRPGALHQAFAAAGFASIRQRCQSDIPYRRVAPVALNAALTLYNAADWVWEHSGLARRFGTFVITVGVKPPEQANAE